MLMSKKLHRTEVLFVLSADSALLLTFVRLTSHCIIISDCPRFSAEFGKRSFSYLAPTVWNDLPLDIRLPPPPIPLSAMSRPNNMGLMSVCTSVRPQKVFPIPMKFGM